MRIFDNVPRFDFMGKRKLAIVFSAILIVLSIGSIISQGLKLGIDFTGGTLIELGYQESVDLESIRSSLQNAGFSDSTVQHFGTNRDVLIRLMSRENQSSSELSDVSILFTFCYSYS